MQMFNINQSILASLIVSKEQSALNQTADSIHSVTAQKMNAHAAAEIRRVQESKNSNSVKLEPDQNRQQAEHKKQQARKKTEKTQADTPSLMEEDNPNLGAHIDIIL